MAERRVPRLVAIAALVGVLLAGLLPGAALAAAPDPRVVFVVGPVGGLTESYRSLARAGAAEARRWTDDVVEVYSPNATWPKVRAAIQGASVVVYLGHGNGFPSPYGNELRRAVQNGFGLNPVAGRGDGAHQYFGEAAIAEQVRLARGAVVLLFRLCYASGNAEPGVPEGTEATARQRVDNFAAGFLAAGASAVVADAYASPAPYVRALLGTKVSARSAWNRSSTAHDNVRAFASERTPGALALMDPERTASGFTRSLVLATGASGLVPAGPVRGAETPPGGWEVVAPPTPTSTPDAFALGARPGQPTLAGLPVAGTTVDLGLPVEVPSDVKLGAAYRIGTRWIPLDGPAAAGDQADAGSASVPDDPAGSIAVVAAEAAASRVDVAEATTEGTQIRAPVPLPTASGRYRLEVTIHDADGVALPYDVQASIPAVVVHVGGPGAAWIDAPASVTVTAGTRASVQLLVTNGEADAWGSCIPVAKSLGLDRETSCPTVRLVGRWLPLDGNGTAPTIVRELDVPAASMATTWLAGPVPAVPGTYLLVATIERTVGADTATVLGRPVAITVDVAVAPLVPTPLVPTQEPEPLLPTTDPAPLVPEPLVPPPGS
jgi:hypothetical protein